MKLLLLIAPLLAIAMANESTCDPKGYQCQIGDTHAGSCCPGLKCAFFENTDFRVSLYIQVLSQPRLIDFD